MYLTGVCLSDLIYIDMWIQGDRNPKLSFFIGMILQSKMSNQISSIGVASLKRVTHWLQGRNPTPHDVWDVNEGLLFKIKYATPISYQRQQFCWEQPFVLLSKAQFVNIIQTISPFLSCCINFHPLRLLPGATFTQIINCL